MEMPEPTTGLIVTIKHLFTYLIAPIIMLLGWLAKKMHGRIETLERQVREVEKIQAVQDNKLQDIKEDIVKMDSKLDRILETLRSRRSDDYQI